MTMWTAVFRLRVALPVVLAGLMSLAIVNAFFADVDLVGIFTGQQKRLGDHAFEHAILMIEHQNPHHGFAVLDFLP